MFGRSILAALALVAACRAQTDGLTISQPSPSLWWVADNTNTLVWSCDTSPYSAYTVVLTNSNTTILSAPFALISDLPNYECSHTVSKDLSHLAVSDTWTLSLADVVNMTNIYASTSFQVKSSDSAYPTSSTSGTATGTAAGSSSTSGSKTGGAIANSVSVGMSMAAALVLGLVVA